MIDDEWVPDWKGLTNEEQRVKEEKLDFWWTYLFAMFLSVILEGFLWLLPL